MVDHSKFSETMRIDISPDVFKDRIPRGKKGIVISRPDRSQSAAPAGGDVGFLPPDLLQSLYDAALVTDLDGRITNVNLRAQDFFLYDHDAFCRLNVLDVICGAQSTLIQTVQENLEDQRFTLIQAYCRRRDHTIFPVEIAVNKMPSGEDRLCFFVRDITTRRQAEERLRTEHNAIQNAGTGIAITDLDGAIDYLNPALLTMCGYEKPEGLLGRNVRALWPDTEAADELIGLIMKDGDRAWTCELTVKRKDDTECDMQVSAASNRDADNIQVGMVFSFVDISDRKRAEDAQRQVERHRVMLESLGAACHHLGQPATVLLANLEIIQRQLKGADDVLDDLIAGCIEATETLSRILHRLNTVNEYRTTQYLVSDNKETAANDRILDIGT